MRGWGYATVLAAICLTASLSAAADEPKKKTTDEEIEESKAALAASQAQTAPPLERGVPYKPSIMPWILGGVGIAGIVAGGAFMLISLNDKSKSDDFESLSNVRTNPNEKSDLLAKAKESDDSSKSNMTIGLIAGGAGVVLLGTGIVWALLDGPPKDATAARVRPAAGPNFAGASLGYAF
jgi:hypothetical protein